MVVRIKLSRGNAVTYRLGQSRRLALAAAALLSPASFMASTLAFWAILSSYRLSGQFAISQGVFSHWQSWLGLAVMLQAGRVALDRYASRTQ